MKIGLVDVDGHHFPNLALMKIASYYKKKGDTVEWCNYFQKYDKVYKSKVFTFSNDDDVCIQADEVIKGGTGYKLYNELFCDNVEPYYSIYPKYTHAYGFLTRGCIRSCPWCIVPKKEGKIRPYRDIETILQGRKSVILMDNNVLASDFGLEQIEKIIDLGCKVDFNQGLDARLITDEIASMLSRVKWIRHIRFSCDTLQCINQLKKAISLLNKHGVKNYKIFVYVLVQNVYDADKICDIMKKLGVTPFAQPYRDYDNTPPTPEQMLFANYVNQRAAFMSTTWQKFNPQLRKKIINERR